MRFNHRVQIRKKHHKMLLQKKRRQLQQQDPSKIPCCELVDCMPQTLEKICLLTRQSNPEMLLTLSDRLQDICHLLPTLNLDNWFIMCQILSDMIDYNPPIISYFQQTIAKSTHSIMLYKGWNFMQSMPMFTKDIEYSIFMLFCSVCKYLTVISLQDINLLSMIMGNKLSRFDPQFTEYKEISMCIQTLNIIFSHNDTLDDEYDLMAKSKIQMKQLKYYCLKQVVINHPLTLKTLIITMDCRSGVLSLLTNLLYNAHAGSFKSIFLQMEMLADLERIIRGQNAESDRILAIKVMNNFLQVAEHYHGDFAIVPFLTELCSKEHGQVLLQALDTFYSFLQVDEVHLRQYLDLDNLSMFMCVFNKMEYQSELVDLAVRFYLFILNRIADRTKYGGRVTECGQLLHNFYVTHQVNPTIEQTIVTALELGKYIESQCSCVVFNE